MSDISKINPGNGTTYTIKDASAVSNLSVSGTILTVTRRNNTEFTVNLPADEKVKVSTSTTNARFPLMAIATSSVTSGKAYQAIYDTGIVINPNKHSVAEGSETTASGTASHAEGHWTLASGEHSHAEGYSTDASGNYSHAEGYNTIALVDGAHAGGIGTIADKVAMTAIGKYNNTNNENLSGDYLFVVGNGTSTSSRSNAFAVTTNGITATSLSVTNATVSGTATVSTAKITNLQATTSTLTGATITNATVSNASITKINGADVGNSPQFTDTNTKVIASTSSTDATYPLMAVDSYTPSSGRAYQAIYDDFLVINPGKHSVAEGYGTFAKGNKSHAEGQGINLSLGSPTSFNDPSCNYTFLFTTYSIDDI